MSARPDRDEAAPYYFTYIDQVPAGDIVAILTAQAGEVDAVLGRISESQSLARYAEGKWSIRDVVNHLSDTERLFQARAFWFARGFDTPLPSFEQEIAVKAADADRRSWESLRGEFQAVRASTVAFLTSLPAEAWSRRGLASGNPFTVRALAFLAAGHVTHHLRLLRERYLAG
jgi:uncharacterized damage-inducible protein DinB